MKLYLIAVLVGILSLVGFAEFSDTPLVPAQIDGKVLYDGQPVINATVTALIANSTGGWDWYAETMSLDTANETFDGYYRIIIQPQDYVIGQTNVRLVAGKGLLQGEIIVNAIEEGTTMGNNILLYTELVDNDGDGFYNDVDCDDNDPLVYPGAPEICNGRDNSCSGFIDDADDICADYDIIVDTCTFDPDGIDNTKDTYTFISVCMGADGCTQAPDNWHELITHECIIGECGADCATDDDCHIECPDSGCYDGVYRVYEKVSPECNNCVCSGGSCTYTTPYTYEICGDGIDNNCNGYIDEHCLRIGEECTEDIYCGHGLVCLEGFCSEIEPFCSIYMPVELNFGWNLIGFPSCYDMDVVDATLSIAGLFGDIFVLENGVWKNYNPNAPAEMNTLAELKPLQGIYMNMSEPAVLKVNNQKV